MHRTPDMRRLVILSLVAASSVARAQAPAPESTPPETTAPGPAPTTNPAPDIAKPAPDAPPQKVKEAKEVAAKAELTPIIPSPKNPTRPAFQLYAEIDLPVLTVGLVFAGVRFIQTRTAYCAPLCDRNDLNALDRTTAGRWRCCPTTRARSTRSTMRW